MSGTSFRGANACHLPRQVVFRTNGPPIMLGGDTGCDVPYYRSRLSLLAACCPPISSSQTTRGDGGSEGNPESCFRTYVPD